MLDAVSGTQWVSEKSPHGSHSGIRQGHFCGPFLWTSAASLHLTTLQSIGICIQLFPGSQTFSTSLLPTFIQSFCHSAIQQIMRF